VIRLANRSINTSWLTRSKNQSFQVHVYHDTASVLDVLLRPAHGIVRPPSRSQAVAMVRKAPVDSRLQHLQDRLLDEPIEHRRDAELAHPSAALRDFPPEHLLRHVPPREQLLADSRPLLPQVVR
jgi:hypothetical protein